jgi:signal peptidase II
LKKYIRDYVYLLGIASIIVVLDQWTKTLVRTLIPFGGSWSPLPWLEPYARIVHWQNTGAAFGMLQGFGLVFTVLAFIVSIAILYYFPRIPRSEWAIRFAMTLQLAGAVGNLIDRLTMGTVTDFISLGLLLCLTWQMQAFLLGRLSWFWQCGSASENRISWLMPTRNMP